MPYSQDETGPQKGEGQVGANLGPPPQPGSCCEVRGRHRSGRLCPAFIAKSQTLLGKLKSNIVRI